MIIKITQIASRIKQTYDIVSDNFSFQGKVGSVNKLQTISMTNRDTTIKGKFFLSRWVNYIPFRWVFGKENLTRAFLLYKNDNIYGTIAFSHHGFLKSFYVIALDSGETFHCYDRSKESFNYISIYQGDKQIALIETYLTVTNYKYIRKLYILDDYEHYADILTFFALYHANYCSSARFNTFIGTQYSKVWSLSRYNNKYDPKWRETNFPNENYFGKLNLFDK